MALISIQVLFSVLLLNSIKFSKRKLKLHFQISLAVYHKAGDILHWYCSFSKRQNKSKPSWDHELIFEFDFLISNTNNLSCLQFPRRPTSNQTGRNTHHTHVLNCSPWPSVHLLGNRKLTVAMEVTSINASGINYNLCQKARCVKQ